MIKQQGKTCADLGITADEITAIEGGVIFYDVREEPFRVYGLYDYKNQPVFRRLPEDVAKATSPNVHGLSRLTTGGRVRFSTSSPFVAIHAVYNEISANHIVPLSAAMGFDLYAKRSGRDALCAIYCPPEDCTQETQTLSMIRQLHGDKNENGEYEVTLNLPIYTGLKSLYIGLAPDATLSRRADYRFEKPVLYYGSSITQGTSATRPGMTYESLISRRLDADFINLGFGGSCKAEDAIVGYLASVECSVFVLDYDHNAPTAQYLAETHEKAYLTFRAAQPDTPVVIISRPDFWFWKKGSTYRRDIICRTYQNALMRGEKVLFVDGSALFHGELREECTTDGTHPNDLGMARMADVIGKSVEFALTMQGGRT